MEFEKVRTGLELKLYELARKITEENGYILYDIDYVRGSSTLSVFIMDEETRTAVIEDCVKVDRGFTPFCEEESWIPDDFVLEVSSPGMYRELKSRQHFKWALGKDILCQLDPHAIEGEEREKLKALGALTNLKIRGKLAAINESEVELELEKEKIILKFEYIKKANLDPAMGG